MITKETLETYITDGLTQREIAAIENCSRPNISRYLKKYNLKTKYEVNGKRTSTYNCTICGTTDSTQFYPSMKSNCTTCHNKKATSTKRIIKKTLVEELGGKCAICGYNKYLGALDFHHLDPSQKDPNYAKLENASLERRRQEVVTKCILLCSNCHKEIHAGVTTLP